MLGLVYDLAIIGGGVQGAGVARDAALRGLKVLLLESNDYASATSSHSSKLIHGGLRYLERFELGLVFEALHEREILLKTARHLVHPLSFLLPFYRHSRRPAWLMRAGLTLYDFLAEGFRRHGLMPTHRILDRTKLLAQIPWLTDQALIGGAEFSDCQMQDARLVVANIMDARAHGADCFNYSTVQAISRNPENHFVLQASQQGKHHTYTARALVNTAGPWVDEIHNLLKTAQPASAPTVCHAKGVHLLIEMSTPLRHAMLLEVPQEKRIFFVLPWHQLYLVGTTDTLFNGDLKNVTADQDDIAYLRRCFEHYLKPSQNYRIVGTMAGVRPLSYVAGKKTRDLSRDWRIIEPQPGIFTVVGGKYTVYRHIAEKLIDRLQPYLAKVGGTPATLACMTAQRSLPGSPQLRDYHQSSWAEFLAIETDRCLRSTAVTIEQANHLVRTYGNAWPSVMQPVTGQTMTSPLVQGEPWLHAEVVHAIVREQAHTVSDLMLRRLSLAFRADHGEKFLQPIGNCLKQLCNYDEAQIQGQIKQYLHCMETTHR